jgi:hypothetical protein
MRLGNFFDGTYYMVAVVNIAAIAVVIIVIGHLAVDTKS